MKKRFPALVLGGILALGLLSGCGQKEAASSVSTAASEPAAAVNGSDQELVFVNYREDVYKRQEVNHQKGKMALAHNGNLSNALELRDRLELSGAIFHTTSDKMCIRDRCMSRERISVLQGVPFSARSRQRGRRWMIIILA